MVLYFIYMNRQVIYQYGFIFNLPKQTSLYQYGFILYLPKQTSFISIWFLLAPLAVGQRAYVMVRCPSCVRPSVCALTFSLNIFFETTYRILMKFHRNVPTMVLFRIS